MSVKKQAVLQDCSDWTMGQPQI